jgi:hypothetical protein
MLHRIISTILLAGWAAGAAHTAAPHDTPVGLAAVVASPGTLPASCCDDGMAQPACVGGACVANPESQPGSAADLPRAALTVVHLRVIGRTPPPPQPPPPQA